MLSRGLIIKRSLCTSAALRVKENFVREKSNLNVGVIGAPHHGKTTLTSLLTQHCHKTHKFIEAKIASDLDNTKSERETGHSQNPSHVELMSEKYHITLSDLPGKPNYVKNLLTHLFGLDLLLLVIDGGRGVEEGTKLHSQLARMAGIQRVVPILNHRSENVTERKETEELVTLDLQEMFGNTEELRNVMAGNFMEPEETFLQNILNAIDTMPEPQRNLESPVYWPLEQVGNIPGRGDFAAGRIKDGSLSLNSNLEIYYEGFSSKINMRDIEIFKRISKDLISGDRGGIFFKQKKYFEVRRGAIIYENKDNFEYKSCKKWKIQFDQQEVADIGKGACVFFYETYMTGRGLLTEESNGTHIISFPQEILAKPGQNIIIRFSNAYHSAQLMECCA